jgi:hypothetical protein
LSSALAKVDPARVYGIHMVQSVMALPERGIGAGRIGVGFRLAAAKPGMAGAVHLPAPGTFGRPTPAPPQTTRIP